MKKFKINPLVLAIAIALPASVHAQTESESVEEVIVSGFRESLANALSIKKESVGSVDTIVAEDIGDFPDNNLADAMARLPGVNIDRTGGEGKSISVRGLSAQFSRVRINGMETVATGYANTGRAFDFNIFASELFSRIDVNKTMKAEFEEGSLGATVDLHTAHPLDGTKDTFMVSYTQGYNDLSKASDPRFTALGSIQNEEGTLGAAVSVAVSKRSITQQGHNSGRWEPNAAIDPSKSLLPFTKTATRAAEPGQFNHWAVVTPAKTTANLCSASLTENCWNDAAYTNYKDTAERNRLNSVAHPRFARQLDREIDIDRVGFTGSIQWKPNDDTKLTLDVLDASLGFDQQDITLTPISLSRVTTPGRNET
ncbi:MAG: TonB-dependent receptor plug domain-containing protein, partial [Cellvibrio sp.]